MRQTVRVLVVEDHESVRRGLCLYLSQLAVVADIAAADSGEAALRVAPEFKPDLMLIDLRLPRTDGLEATRILRRRGETMRIVAMSDDPQLREKALAAGADAFVDKLDLPQRLMALLAEATGGGEPRSGRQALYKEKE